MFCTTCIKYLGCEIKQKKPHRFLYEALYSERLRSFGVEPAHQSIFDSMSIKIDSYEIIFSINFLDFIRLIKISSLYAFSLD